MAEHDYIVKDISFSGFWPQGIGHCGNRNAWIDGASL